MMDFFDLLDFFTITELIVLLYPLWEVRSTSLMLTTGTALTLASSSVHRFSTAVVSIHWFSKCIPSIIDSHTTVTCCLDAGRWTAGMTVDFLLLGPHWAPRHHVRGWFDNRSRYLRVLVTARTATHWVTTHWATAGLMITHWATAHWATTGLMITHWAIAHWATTRSGTTAIFGFAHGPTAYIRSTPVAWVHASSSGTATADEPKDETQPDEQTRQSNRHYFPVL